MSNRTQSGPNLEAKEFWGKSMKTRAISGRWGTDAWIFCLFSVRRSESKASGFIIVSMVVGICQLNVDLCDEALPDMTQRREMGSWGAGAVGGPYESVDRLTPVIAPNYLRPQHEANKISNSADVFRFLAFSALMLRSTLRASLRRPWLE